MMGSGRWRTACAWLGCAVLGLLASGTALARESVQLPDVAKQAVLKEFPGATIKEVGRERERGVSYYEVELKWQGKELEVEVAADGSIGEIEEELALKDLPDKVAAKAKEIVGDGSIKGIERHDVRGVPGKGTFQPSPTPKIVYEIKYIKDGKKHEVELVVTGDSILVATNDDDGDDDDDDDDDDD